jgi:hypothetical protein
MQGATRWLDEYRQYWEQSFDRLSDYLTAVQQEEQDR